MTAITPEGKENALLAQHLLLLELSAAGKVSEFHIKSLGINMKTLAEW